jgi:hypothetical protein
VSGCDRFTKARDGLNFEADELRRLHGQRMAKPLEHREMRFDLREDVKRPTLQKRKLPRSRFYLF